MISRTGEVRLDIQIVCLKTFYKEKDTCYVSRGIEQNILWFQVPEDNL